jgi:hypothetical protein
MSMLLISILRSIQDRADHLRQSLFRVLAAAEATIRPCGVAIVDNGSMDVTPRALAECSTGHRILRVMTDSRPSKARALNRALPNLRYKATLFTDYVQVPVGWVEDVAAPIPFGKTDTCAGRARLAEHLDRPLLTGNTLIALAELELVEPEHLESGMVGPNMAVVTSVAENICFDEALEPVALGSGDDILFKLRLKAVGCPAKGIQQESAENNPDPSRVPRDTVVDWLGALARAVPVSGITGLASRSLSPRSACDWRPSGFSSSEISRGYVILFRESML